METRDVPWVCCKYLRLCVKSKREIGQRRHPFRLFQAVLLSSPDDLETVVYLVSNEVAPSYEGLELGIGVTVSSSLRSHRP